MATTYTKTENYGLDLYGDDDPADLRAGHNSNMVKIDAELKTLENASVGYQVIAQAQESATQAASSAGSASTSASQAASSAESASTSASQAASSAATASTAATTATDAVAAMPVVMTASDQSAAATLSAANPTAWVYYPEAA